MKLSHFHMLVYHLHVVFCKVFESWGLFGGINMLFIFWVVGVLCLGGQRFLRHVLLIFPPSLRLAIPFLNGVFEWAGSLFWGNLICLFSFRVIFCDLWETLSGSQRYCVFLWKLCGWAFPFRSLCVVWGGLRLLFPPGGSAVIPASFVSYPGAVWQPLLKLPV